jgi:hypothetical protein
VPKRRISPQLGQLIRVGEQIVGSALSGYVQRWH